MDACHARPGSICRCALLPVVFGLLLASCGVPTGTVRIHGEGAYRSCLVLSPVGHARVSPFGPGGRIGTWPG